VLGEGFAAIRHRGAGGTVLVADDEPTILTLVSRLLQDDGFAVITADDGAAALTFVQHQCPDIVLLDVQMPHIDGIEVCRRLKNASATRLLPVVLITGLSHSEDRVRGIEAGADDFLTKPVVPAELRARVRSLVRLKRYTDDLDSAEETILTLATTIEARDPGTSGHCERLAKYAVALGRYLSLSHDELLVLRRGGFLHDIGKIAVPDAVLLKPSTLTPSEWALIREHPVVGDRLCSRLRSLEPVRPIVRHHHERLDGSGYPDGLKGEAVPLLAQIISVVDTYDALTMNRPYKQALAREAAWTELRADVARGWKNSDLVEALAHVVGTH
jgi:putative two-component system response regulator